MALLACAYRNGTDRMVIVRCEGHGGFYLERVVFPFELLSFSGPPQCEVEVWTHGIGGPELMDKLPIHELLIESATSPAQLELVHRHNDIDDDEMDVMEAAAG